MQAITSGLCPSRAGTAAGRLIVAIVLLCGVCGCRSAQPDGPTTRAVGGESTPAVGSTADSADTAGAKTASPPAEPLSNTLRWKTASEVDNFGFDVYRADSEEGPFERLTERPIPGAGTTDEPQQYVFVDDTIEAGRTYWYYVESISMMGVRERFTPVFRAKPKGTDEVASEGSRQLVDVESDGGSEGDG